MTDVAAPDVPLQRHPLGLPKGSVRALMALSIFGSVVFLLLLDRTIDSSLWLINYVVLGHYFASRQTESAPDAASAFVAPSPLRLPKGSVRRVILAAFFLTSAYLIWTWSQSQRSIWEHPSFSPMLSLAGFFVGRLTNTFFGWIRPKNSSFVRLFQDGRALFALLCTIVLVGAILFNFNAEARESAAQFSTVYILFYFGSR